jgi:hypothetical protein
VPPRVRLQGFFSQFFARTQAAIPILFCMDGQIAPTELPAGRSPARLWVHVLATTVEGTRCALTSASRLTDGHQARIVLLVPVRNSSRVSLDPSSEEQHAIVDEYRSLAASVEGHVTVLFCLCRRPDDVVHSMLGRYSLVIVGGRSRAWWPSREERLVRRLAATGYPVVFAQVGTERALAGDPVMVS